ncbi:MAG: hypothetical protein QG657_1881 [Acidobacteriota bacterium]|nr:hypothetical protein [Acidobacteriota bacterium]
MNLIKNIKKPTEHTEYTELTFSVYSVIVYAKSWFFLQGFILGAPIRATKNGRKAFLGCGRRPLRALFIT